MGVFDRLHQNGNTIVLVTHEADIAAYAHRVIHIRDGQVEKDVKAASERMRMLKRSESFRIVRTSHSAYFSIQHSAFSIA